MRGFGIVDSDDYRTVAKCQHNGFDLVSTQAGVSVYAVADGIVVGMGDPFEPTKRPFLWGATQGTWIASTGLTFNLIIRTGGHFVLYGHLLSIEEALFVGSRVTAGQIVGRLADQGSNTHLHVQVSAYLSQNPNSNHLRSRIGAIIADGTASENPRWVADFASYLGNQGTTYSTANASVGNCTFLETPNATYSYTNYSGAGLGSPGNQATFWYQSKDAVARQCFDIATGNTIPYQNCLTTKP